MQVSAGSLYFGSEAKTMKDNAEILKLRVLLCFLKLTPADCSVTGIARTLGREKYAISRAVSALEAEGLVDRADIRRPRLTEKGYAEASRYAERFEIALNHLLYEGVDMESARQDAFVWTLYCTDGTMETVRATEKRYRVKYELRGQGQFSGAALCRRLKDGCYALPFLIFREHIKNGSNLSMANEGFEHPCILSVKNGMGTVQLRSIPITAKSPRSGEIMQGRVETIRYFDAGRFVCAEPSGQLFSFPADVLQFVSVGADVGQILHGSVCLQMESSVGAGHMPESTAIFTLLL